MVTQQMLDLGELGQRVVETPRVGLEQHGNAAPALDPHPHAGGHPARHLENLVVVLVKARAIADERPSSVSRSETASARAVVTQQNDHAPQRVNQTDRFPSRKPTMLSSA